MAVFLSIGLTDKALAREIAIFAAANRHENITVASSAESEEALGIYACDLVFYMLDSANRENWPGMMPLARLPGGPDIIAVTRRDDTIAGEFAIQAGCWDVLALPCGPETLRSVVSRCLSNRRIKSEQDARLDTVTLKRDQIIGTSQVLQRLLQQLRTIARSDSSVLILGETGTGKELFAKAVHDNSRRADKPMVVVDCTNLPPTLAESLLFGHARGSFTGAVEATDGLFKQADGGTIFLDEIGELDLSVQKSLLRVIQERRFRPLSAKKEISCDFRIIAATNQDLEAMVQQGSFRQDLYHRINTQTIVLPPLRSRAEDIPLLARHYVDMFCKNQNLPRKEIAPETVEALKLYRWPGNIRELVNVLHSTVLKAAGYPRVYPQHLPEDIRLFLMRAQISTQDLMEKAGRNHTLQSGLSGVSGLSGFTGSSGNSDNFSDPEGFMSATGFTSASVASGSSNVSYLSAAPYSEAAPGAFGSANESYPDISGLSRAAHHTSTQGAANEAGGIHNAEKSEIEQSDTGFAGNFFADSRPIAQTEQKTTAATPYEAEHLVFDFPARPGLPSYKEARTEFVFRMEAHYLVELIARSDGDFARAQEISGLSRARLYELLKHHRLSI